MSDSNQSSSSPDVSAVGSENASSISNSTSSTTVVEAVQDSVLSSSPNAPASNNNENRNSTANQKATTSQQKQAHRTSATEAHERAVRFGLVFTQLGAATKEEVFPHGVRHMPRLLTLKEVTESKLRRQSLEELDAKIRRTRSWWWPFGWFGPPTAEEVEMRRREAQRKIEEAARKRQIKEAKDKALQVEQERTLKELQAKIAGERQAEDDATAAAESKDEPAEPLAPPPKPKLYPLKVDIVPRALTEEEEKSLSVSVFNQRQAILETEKQIHQMLDTVERTRMQYLRPSQKGLKCEKEIISVLSCYDDASAKYKSTQNRAASLKCATSVDLLEQCSREVAKAHTRQ